MASQKPEKKWRALKGFRDCNDTRPLPGTVDIVQSDKSIDLGSDKGPFGVPIRPKLGIKLISRFHQRLDNPITDSLLWGKKFNIEDYQFEDKDQKKLLQNVVETLIDLLRKSSAITIEKDVILKTLSQPECEAVRFYLC